MIYTVKFTTAYKKSYKLMKKRGLDLTLLDDVVDDLRQGKALDEKYKDHILKGDYAGFHECHIKPDWLLISLRHCFIVGHVHDELIIECSPDVNLNVICKQMGRSPDWMPDILLRADGYLTMFYKKV